MVQAKGRAQRLFDVRRFNLRLDLASQRESQLTSINSLRKHSRQGVLLAQPSVSGAVWHSRTEFFCTINLQLQLLGTCSIGNSKGSTPVTPKGFNPQLLLIYSSGKMVGYEKVAKGS